MPSPVDTVSNRLRAAADRVRRWFHQRLDDQSLDIARLYASQRDRFVYRIGQVYGAYLGDEPSIARARASGAGWLMDQVINETTQALGDELGRAAIRHMADTLDLTPAELRQHYGEWAGMDFQDLPDSTQRVVRELTTSVVGGGTFFDRVYNVTDDFRNTITKTIRGSLLNGDDFMTLRGRMMKAFGVDKLADPVGPAYGSVRLYRNAAASEFSDLMRELAADSDGITVWISALLPTSTPGCVARHGTPIGIHDDELPPRHPNCLCTVGVFPKDADLSELVAQADAWLADKGYSRRQAARMEAAREAAAEWDEKKHPRAPAGQPEGGEFTSGGDAVPKRLQPAVATARHYDTFEDFERDWIGNNYHGIYWHLTSDPNFSIDPRRSPKDASSMAGGAADGTPGLMVTTDVDNWSATLGAGRKYAAEIDLGALTPNTDYRAVKRGFGHEIFVFKPGDARVLRVVPLASAKRINARDYSKVLPQGEEDLRAIWNAAHRKREAWPGPAPDLILEAFDPALHPRAPAGDEHGGEFTDAPGGGDARGGGAEPERKTAEILGFTPNPKDAKAVGKLLTDREVALEKIGALVDEVVGGEATSSSGDDDEETSWAESDDWDSVPGEIQSQAEEKWKEQNHAQEMQYEQEQQAEYATTQAAEDLSANEGLKRQIAEEILTKMGYRFDADDAQWSLTFDGGDNTDGDISAIKLDPKFLASPADPDPDQLTIPGVNPEDVKYAARAASWTQGTIGRALAQADDDEWSPDATPETYFAGKFAAAYKAKYEELRDELADTDVSEQVDESLNDAWGELPDSEKFDFAKDNFEPETGGSSSSGTVSVPEKFHPFVNDGDTSDYDKTRALALALAARRTEQIAEERGVTVKGEPLTQADAKQIASNVWKEWKSNSHESLALSLHMAAHQEFGAPLLLNTDQMSYAGSYAKDYVPGGMGGLRSYLRGLWETTQYVLDQAGYSAGKPIAAWRGIMLPGEQVLNTRKIHEPYPGSDAKDERFVGSRLPDLALKRNAVSSWTTDENVANSWGGMGGVNAQLAGGAARVVLTAQVPPTSFLSLPVYGQNVHSEQEAVILGLGWKSWEAWNGGAPSNEDYWAWQNAKKKASATAIAA